MKFRAWDSFNEAFYYSEKEGLPKFFKIVADLNAAGNNLIVDEFTGILDKNKTDIYERDILCWPDYEGRKSLQTRWVVEWDEKASAWSNWYPRDEAQVIGNAHQNPELL